MTIEFSIPIKPKAWQRVASGKGGFAFVPKETRIFKQEFALLASRHRPRQPLEGPLNVSLTFVMEKPKKPSKSYPRGDIDNYSKSVEDALNGVIWVDDSQIVKLTASKLYGPKAFIHVLIEEVPEEQKVGPISWISPNAPLKTGMITPRNWQVSETSSKSCNRKLTPTSARLLRP